MQSVSARAHSLSPDSAVIRMRVTAQPVRAYSSAHARWHGAGTVPRNRRRGPVGSGGTDREARRVPRGSRNQHHQGHGCQQVLRAGERSRTDRCARRLNSRSRASVRRADRAQTSTGLSTVKPYGTGIPAPWVSSRKVTSRSMRMETVTSTSLRCQARDRAPDPARPAGRWRSPTPKSWCCRIRRRSARRG